jgi:hypothetical protein
MRGVVKSENLVHLFTDSDSHVDVLVKISQA